MAVRSRLMDTVDPARSLRDRLRGLLGRDGLKRALLLEPASSVHTIGMRFALDAVRFAAWGPAAGSVLATARLPARMEAMGPMPDSGRL